MIPKNLQHELFENEGENRLVYLGAFDADAERAHSDRIRSLEVVDAANPPPEEIAKLQEGIYELKRQIKELQHLLYVEDPDNPLDFVPDDDGLKKDKVAIRGGYGTDDYASFGSALQVATGNAGENASADFQIEFDTYRRTFEDIRAMTFEGQIADWEPDGGDQSHEIPEIGLENFAELLTNPQLTLSPRDDSGLMWLYNEHGLEIQVPSTMAEMRPDGDVLDMRNEPIRRGLGIDVETYLLPIWYGGQELYVSSQDVKVPDKEDFKLEEYNDTDDKYTLPGTGSALEIPFDRDMFADRYSWWDVIGLARAYEIQKEGGPRGYAIELFKKGKEKLEGTPSLGDIMTAWEYAFSAISVDTTYADIYYLYAEVYMRLLKLDSNPYHMRLSTIEGFITAYESPGNTGKTSDEGIARLKREVEVWELSREEDVHAHEAPTLDLLGGDADILYSTKLRGELAPLKDKLTLDPTRRNIDNYKGKREELEQAMEIETTLANEYFDKGDDQPTENLLELYFDIEGNGGVNLSAFLRGQLTKEGGALEDFFSDGYLVHLSIEALKGLVSELVISQVEGRRIDLDSAAMRERLNNPEELKETLPTLFLSGSETFDGLDTNDDGIVILEIEGKIYAIEREETELEVEMRDLYYDAINAELGKEIEYLGKDFTEGLGGRPQTDPLGGGLNVLFKGDPLGQAAQKAHAKRLGKKMGLTGEPTVQEVKVALEQLELDLAGELFNPHSSYYDLAGYTRGFKYLADWDTRLAPFSEKTQAKIREYAGRASAYEAGDKSQGGRIRLEMRYLSKDGEVHTNIHEAPATMLSAIAEEVNLPILQAGLRTASMDPSMRLPEIQRAADEARMGSAPGRRTGRHSGKPKDPLGTAIAQLIGRPEKPDMPPIPPDATPEVKAAIQTERATLAENYAVDLTKRDIERKVYRGRRDSKMAKVFREAPVEQLEKFYQEVNVMRSIKTPGDEREGYRQDWGATFLSLVGEAKTGDIHLIGRPLILYNMINRAHQVAETYKLNVLAHGLNGDDWLDAMARQQYDIRHGAVSNIKDIPELEDPENPKRLEGFPGIMTDLMDPGFTNGQIRAYRIHTSNDPDEFPFIIRVKREAGGYEIHYGEDEAVFTGGELLPRFVKMILKPTLSERNNWENIHAFRVSTIGLDDSSMEDYYDRYIGNRTSEELETEIDDQLLAIMKEISKESKLQLPELKKLLDRPHSEIFSRVWAILTGVKKTGPGERTLSEPEFSAAKLYLEKLDYRLHGTYEEGDPEEEAGGKGIGYLRDVAKTKWHDRSAKLEEKKDKKSERLAGKETGESAPTRRPSAMERLESLGLRGRMARRAKRVYYKLTDDLFKKSGGGLLFRDMEHNRYKILARNSAAMDNNLGMVFAGMVAKAERLKGTLIAKGLDLRGNRGAIVLRDNTVDDALLRMAAIATRGENAELPCSVAYVLGDSDRAGPKIADRGEGYASPRLRKSVYRRYT